MKEETKKLTQRLNKFSKEQIIGEITESYQFSFYLESLISNLEYRSQQDLLAKYSSAIDAERCATNTDTGDNATSKIFQRTKSKREQGSKKSGKQLSKRNVHFASG